MRVIELPSDEPPPHVKDALRVVLAWIRTAEEDKRRQREAYDDMMRRAQERAEAAKDWRDGL